MLLSICIPTYNRASKLSELLFFLYDELQKINSNEIEVLIGNNNSTDDTESVVSNFLKKTKPIYTFRYYKNKQNLGLIGNLFELCKKAKGTYIWWMGDDDLYHPNIIQHIYKELNKRIYSFIFINHCCYENSIIKIT